MNEKRALENHQQPKLRVAEVNARNWWEEYPQLNSASFTYENSGNKLGESHPFAEKMDGGLKPIIGVSSMFEILGYTLNPPFSAPFQSVAIMFERKDDFSKLWFHYVR